MNYRPPLYWKYDFNFFFFMIALARITDVLDSASENRHDSVSIGNPSSLGKTVVLHNSYNWKYVPRNTLCANFPQPRQGARAWNPTARSRSAHPISHGIIHMIFWKITVVSIGTIFLQEQRSCLSDIFHHNLQSYLNNTTIVFTPFYLSYSRIFTYHIHVFSHPYLRCLWIINMNLCLSNHTILVE